MLRLGDFVLVVGLLLAWYLGTRPRYLGEVLGLVAWYLGTRPRYLGREVGDASLYGRLREDIREEEKLS